MLIFAKKKKKEKKGGGWVLSPLKNSRLRRHYLLEQTQTKVSRDDRSLITNSVRHRYGHSKSSYFQDFYVPS